MANNNLKEFDEFFKSKLKNKLFEIYHKEEQSECIKKVIDRFRAMVDYNIPHGKKLRGLCSFESLLHLVGLDINKQPYESKYLSEKNYDPNKLVEEAKAIGWCIEFVSFRFLTTSFNFRLYFKRHSNKIAAGVIFSCRRYNG
jgi:hypothetical protein